MKRFYCVEGGQTKGPFSLEELKGKGLKSIDLVCPEGETNWVRIDSIEGWRTAVAPSVARGHNPPPSRIPDGPRNKQETGFQETSASVGSTSVGDAKDFGKRPVVEEVKKGAALTSSAELTERPLSTQKSASADSISSIDPKSFDRFEGAADTSTDPNDEDWDDWILTLNKRKNLVIVGTVIVCLISIPMFMHETVLIDFLKSLRTTYNPDTDMADEIDSKTSTISGYFLLAYIPTGIFAVRWLHHIHMELRRREKVSWGEHQAFWGWIIPILAWYRPVQILRRFLATLQKSAAQQSADSVSIFWWICWTAFGILSSVANRYVLWNGDPSIDELIIGAYWDHFATGFLIVSGPLFVATLHFVSKAAIQGLKPQV